MLTRLLSWPLLLFSPGPADLLPPGENTPPPAPRERPTSDRDYINCDFCECRLTKHGEVLHLGEKAKKYQKHDRDLDAKDTEIVALKRQLAEAQTKLDEHAARAHPDRSYL